MRIVHSCVTHGQGRYNEHYEPMGDSWTDAKCVPGMWVTGDPWAITVNPILNINDVNHRDVHYNSRGARGFLSCISLVVLPIIGWVWFLVDCFLYNSNLNPRKHTCCGKKWPKICFSPKYSWIGLLRGLARKREQLLIYRFNQSTPYVCRFQVSA